MTDKEKELQAEAIAYYRKQIAELKGKISVLLSCKNCSENKGGYICEKEYENKCLAQKIEFIKELQKENELLKGRTEEFEKQILGLLYKYESVYKRFPDLKDAMNEAERILKENAKLKEKLKPENCLKLLAKEGYVKFTCENGNEHDQLTKAKEIIKKLKALFSFPIVTEDDIKRQDEILTEAEQFLNSEVQK